MTLPTPLRRLRPALILPYAIIVLVGWHDLTWIVAEVIAPHAGTVDFGVYQRGALALADGRRLYAQPPPCCFSYTAMDGRYTYPPLLAILLWPLAHLTADVAGRIFLLVSLASLTGAVALMFTMIRAGLSHRASAWLGVAVLSYQPVFAVLYGIQIGAVLLLVETIAAWAVVRGRRGGLAGTALAFGGALKLLPFLCAPALLMFPARARRRAIVALAATAGLCLALMQAVTGETAGYFLRILPSFSAGVVAPWNRSLPGVVLRTVAATGHAPSPSLRFGFVTVEAAALAFTWWCCRGARTERARACAFAAMIAVIPIVQGVTWDQHLISEVLVFALIAPALRPRTGAWWLTLAGIVLTSVNQQGLEPRLASLGFGHPQGAGLLVFVAGASVNLIGMVCLWLAALRCLATVREDDPDAIDRAPVMELRSVPAAYHPRLPVGLRGAS